MKRFRMCSVEGCDGLFWARGFCHNHYKRWRKYGNPVEPDHREALPTPHERCHFVITRYENERWHKENAMRLTRYLKPHSALYIAAHAAEMEQERAAA